MADVSSKRRRVNQAYPFNPQARQEPTETERLISELSTRGLMPIVLEVCARHGVLIGEIVGRGRSKSLTRARHECFLAIREMPSRSYSYPEIGRMFGKDHTGVLAGVRRAAEIRSTQVASESTPSIPDLLPATRKVA